MTKCETQRVSFAFQSLENIHSYMLVLTYYYGVHGQKHCSLCYIVILELKYVLGVGKCNFEIWSFKFVYVLVICNVAVITFYN